MGFSPFVAGETPCPGESAAAVRSTGPCSFRLKTPSIKQGAPACRGSETGRKNQHRSTWLPYCSRSRAGCPEGAASAVESPKGRGGLTPPLPVTMRRRITLPGAHPSKNIDEVSIPAWLTAAAAICPVLFGFDSDKLHRSDVLDNKDHILVDTTVFYCPPLPIGTLHNQQARPSGRGYSESSELTGSCACLWFRHSATSLFLNALGKSSVASMIRAGCSARTTPGCRNVRAHAMRGRSLHPAAAAVNRILWEATPGDASLPRGRRATTDGLCQIEAGQDGGCCGERSLWISGCESTALIKATCAQ